MKTKEPDRPSLLAHLSPGAVLAILGAFTAVVTGAVALLFQLAPGLRPQDPPRRKAVEITALLVDQNVTLGEYQRRFDDATFERDLREALGDKAESFREVLLRREGMVVYAQIRSEGFKGGTLRPPIIHFYDHTGHRIAGEQRASLDDRTSECLPRVADDQCVAAVFKLCAPRLERVRVWVEVRDKDRRLMDIDRTAPIRCGRDSPP